jgi:hypothetical protein
MDESAEDNARLIALQSSEQSAHGCQTAVPKLEGAVTLLEQSGNDGAVVWVSGSSQEV